MLIAASAAYDDCLTISLFITTMYCCFLLVSIVKPFTWTTSVIEWSRPSTLDEKQLALCVSWAGRLTETFYGFPFRLSFYPREKLYGQQMPLRLLCISSKNNHEDDTGGGGLRGSRRSTRLLFPTSGRWNIWYEKMDDSAGWLALRDSSRFHFTRHAGRLLYSCCVWWWLVIISGSALYPNSRLRHQCAPFERFVKG